MTETRDVIKSRVWLARHAKFRGDSAKMSTFASSRLGELTGFDHDLTGAGGSLGLVAGRGSVTVGVWIVG